MNIFVHALGLLMLLFVSATSALELHDAAKQGDLEKVKSLYSLGVDINSRNDFDMTALHFTANYGHKELVDYLIDKGAQINGQNKNGYTPLMLAVNGGHIDIVHKLVSRGADINLQADTFPFQDACIKRYTALSLAWDKHDKEMVRWLISKGANVNVDLSPGDLRCGGGPTLFLKVVSSKDYDMVKLFLEHGADVHAKYVAYVFQSKRLVWIGSLEASRGNNEIIELLRSYGAETAPAYKGPKPHEAPIIWTLD